MKKLIFPLILFVSLSLSAQEAAYNQWQNTIVTPHYDKMQAFGEALHEHNKLYHQDAASAASVWRVVSGPNVGKWVLSSGPHTYGSRDDLDLGAEHGAHWRNKVMPTFKKIEDGGTWRAINDLSYIPEGAVITKARVIIHDMTGEGSEGYRSAMKKLTEATAKGSPATARIFLRRVGFHNDNMDNVVFIGLNKWADLDGSGNSYEEVHGEGSWDLFLEEVGAAIKSSYEEHWVHIPYLSGIGGDE